MSSPDQTCGVALLGDALHAFPPDIGQGINAGLSNAVAFDRALQGKDVIAGKDGQTPENLGAALKEYERVQGPEVCFVVDCSECHLMLSRYSCSKVLTLEHHLAFCEDVDRSVD